jgi:hypothetical protein
MSKAMIESRWEPVTIPVGPDHQGAERQRLLLLLRRLMDDLCRSREFGKGASENVKGETWSDDNFIYVEEDLPPGSDLEADVSFHDGRVFVRVERSRPAPKVSRGTESRRA